MREQKEDDRLKLLVPGERGRGRTNAAETTLSTGLLYCDAGAPVLPLSVMRQDSGPAGGSKVKDRCHDAHRAHPSSLPVSLYLYPSNRCP